MLRFLSRSLLAAAVATSAAACAATTGDVQDAGEEGGRYRVLVPELAVQGGAPAGVGENVAKSLRSMITGMATHTAVSERQINSAKRQYEVGDLDAATSRQLAQAMGVQLAAWGTIENGAGGLQADVQFVDVRSGDEIVLEDVSGADPQALAQNIFQGFQQQIEGLRQAVFCNDYLSSQQFDRALEVCEQALAVAPQSTGALYGKATALYNMDRYDESLQVYNQLLELNPEHQEGLLGAGLAASKAGQTQQATQYYTRYMELNPGDVTVRMKVAGDIAQTGDYVSAFAVLEPAATENADNLDFQQYLAQVATAAGQQAKEQNDPNTQRYFETGLAAYENVFEARGDSLEAPVLRQAIAVNVEMGRTQDALRLAEMATQRFPDEAGVWSTYATVLNKADRHADEAEALNRALQLDPQLENGRIRLALAYMEAGNRQAALSNLRQAAEGGNRENVARAIYGMASAPLRQENWSEAASLLEMAHQYAAGNTKSDIAFFWGYSLVKQGERIAKANTEGSAQRAREALAFFQDAVPLLQASAHQNAQGVLSGAQQYIANQEAIIEAARN